MNRLASAALAAALLAAGTGVALAATPAPAASGAAATAPQRNDAEATRMTDALNLLEAQGYGDFTNFRQDGKNFAVTVTRNGRPQTVVADPDAATVTPQG
jgi:hypothetical protein